MPKRRKAAPSPNIRIRENVKKDESSGVIRAGELYTMNAIKRRLDISDSALRSMMNEGLQPVPMGKRKFFLGEDVLKFFREVSCA